MWQKKSKSDIAARTCEHVLGPPLLVPAVATGSGQVPQLELVVGGGRHEVRAVHPADIRHRLGVAPDHRQRHLQ